MAVEGRTCCEKCLREAAHPFQAEMSHPVQSQEAATQPLLWFTKERLAHSQPALLAGDFDQERYSNVTFGPMKCKTKKAG